MGDIRYQHAYRVVTQARDRAAAIRRMSDSDIVAALAAAAQEDDPYIANILASEAHNRVRRKALILDTAAEGLIALDPAGNITFANPAARRLLGRASDDLRGMSVHRALCVHGEGEAECEIAPALGSGATAKEAVFARHGGGSFFAAFTSAPIEHKGEYEGDVVVFADVSEIRASARALRDSEARLRRMFESAADALVVHDLEGNIVDLNHRACELVGYTREELLHMRISDVETTVESAKIAELWRNMTPEQPARVAGVLRRKDGKLVPADVTLSVFDTGERPLILASAREIIHL